MPITRQSNIIPLLHHLCLALQPYASSQNIRINFTTSINDFIIRYNPCKVIQGVSEILCAIISYLPKENTINLKASVVTVKDTRIFQLHIYNTGINLSGISEITANINFPVSIVGAEANETTFIINLNGQPDREAYVSCHSLNKTNIKIPVFFQEVQRRLKSYFTTTDTQRVGIHDRHPRDSVFLKKLNEVIQSNIDKENFDANALSKEMALSRAQLLRKLKPLIRQSPGCYIKSLRLQKAKELLENEDLSVSEAAYKTGFQTPSHFTKVFIEKYGIRPSLFRRPKPSVTNE